MSLQCGNSSTPLNTNDTTALNSSSIQQCSGAIGTTGDEQSHLGSFESMSQPTDISEEGLLPEQAGARTGIRSSRFTIFLIIFGLQLPLLTTFAFGSDLFFDGTLQSLVILCVFCVIIIIQLLLIVFKMHITVFEIIVYLLFLAGALAATSYTFYQQLFFGIDNLKSFVLNIAGLILSGILVLYDMYIGYRELST